MSQERKPIRLGVLISGSGTNLQAIIDRIAAGALDAEVAIVISSRPSAYGLKRAEAAGIQTMSLSKEVYADPITADEVHAPILRTFENRVVNLHPALLPSFKGAHAIQDAFDYGVKVTGVTVHFADDKYDCGPIIAQRALPVREDWDVDTLEAHIHEIEHELYPDTIQLLAEGRVHVEGNKVVVDPPAGA